MTSLVGCPCMDVISTPQSEQCAFFAKRKKSFFLKFIIKLTLCGRLKSQTSISNIGWVNSQGCHFLAFLIWLMPFFQLDKNWKTFSDFIYCGWTRFFCRPAITSLPWGMISMFIPLWVCQLIGASFETWIWQFINFFLFIVLFPGTVLFHWPCLILTLQCLLNL